MGRVQKIIGLESGPSYTFGGPEVGLRRFKNDGNMTKKGGMGVVARVGERHETERRGSSGRSQLAKPVLGASGVRPAAD
jgi:hypothetical protein